MSLYCILNLNSPFIHVSWCYYYLQDNKNIWKLIIGKHNLTLPVSSYSRPEIMTKSQTYFFTHSVKTISVTLTAKGITSKQLLIGTIGDQVSLGLTCLLRLNANAAWLIMLTLCYVINRFWLLTSAFWILVGLQNQPQQNWKMELYLLQIHYLSIHRYVVLLVCCHWLLITWSLCFPVIVLCLTHNQIRGRRGTLRDPISSPF